MAVVIESAKLRPGERGRTLRTSRLRDVGDPNPDDRAPAPVTPPVDEKVAAALARAQAAEQALSALRDNIDAERERAREQGYADAIREAAVRIEADRSERLDALETLLQNMASTADNVVAEAEDDIVAIAFEAVTKIIGRSAADRRAVKAAVRKAIRQVAAERNLVVRVSPADYAWLASEADELLPRSPGRRLDLVADEGIRAGGCIVDSGAGALDARFDVQLEQLRRLLLATRKARNEDPA